MQCPRCEGSGRCAECAGSGSIECPNCQGKGKKSTSRGAEFKCKVCAAEGTISCPVHCSSCEGTGSITEELQSKTREKYQTRFANFTPASAVTIPLIAINIAVFLAIKFDPTLFDVLSLNQDSFHRHHYWAVITPCFTHYSVLHIGLNLFFLWVYGQVMEGLLGKKKFVTLFLLSGLGATALSWLGNVVLDERYYAGVGASGPLYGLIGAMAALHLRWRMIPAEEAKKLVTWAVGFLLLGFALRGTAYDILDNWAHLGGALSGFIAIYLLPRPEGH